MKPGFEQRGLRAVDAARYLGIGQSTLWALRAAGELEAVVLGTRTTVFLRESLDAYIDRKRADQAEKHAPKSARPRQSNVPGVLPIISA